MDSQFYNVALDRIRYSLVWEDSSTLYRGLAIQQEDCVLVITSAGCNVLNTLLKKPRQVVAIDLNPVQNTLLRLKCHLILHHEYAVFRGLMGFDGAVSVKKAWQQLESSLPVDMKWYWDSFFESHPEGILTAGRLEAYLTGFLKTLDPLVQQKLRALMEFDEVASQRNFFLKELHPSAFREKFIEYFNNDNLSKGRAPELYTYAQESGGEVFYQRLLKQMSSILVKQNFYFRFIFFGPTGLPETLWPPCYQRKNYALLRKQLPKVTMVEGEAIEYLLSAAGALVNKASLSNIFEYTSQQEFEKVVNLLLLRANPKLQFVFWNLLQEQGAFLATTWLATIQSLELAPLAESCFYFRNVRTMERIPAPVMTSD